MGARRIRYACDLIYGQHDPSFAYEHRSARKHGRRHKHVRRAAGYGRSAAAGVKPGGAVRFRWRPTSAQTSFAIWIRQTPARWKESLSANSLSRAGLTLVTSKNSEIKRPSAAPIYHASARQRGRIDMPAIRHSHRGYVDTRHRGIPFKLRFTARRVGNISMLYDVSLSDL